MIRSPEIIRPVHYAMFDVIVIRYFIIKLKKLKHVINIKNIEQIHFASVVPIDVIRRKILTNNERLAFFSSFFIFYSIDACSFLSSLSFFFSLSSLVICIFVFFLSHSPIIISFECVVQKKTRARERTDSIYNIIFVMKKNLNMSIELSDRIELTYRYPIQGLEESMLSRKRDWREGERRRFYLIRNIVEIIGVR